jgi:prephenate dehydratase
MSQRIAYLGPEGSFCGAAARELTRDRDVELVAASTVQTALDSARAGDVEAALVPIENSVEGSVSVTLDELANGKRLVIVDEVVIPVRFALLGRPGASREDITRIATHPHAQAQARHWLAEHYPHAQIIPAMSTAAAAQALTDPEAPFDAAVSQRIAADIYGLEVIADDIQDTDDATTRFVLVRLPGDIPAPTGADKTTLSLFMRQDEPGALLAILTEFVDVEGHVADARVSEALMGLHRVCLDVRFLGSYPRHDGKEPGLRPGVSDRDFAGAQEWLDRLKGSTS